MKKILGTAVICITLLVFSVTSEAATFTSGSTGADGAFNPPTQVPIGTIIDTTNNMVTVPLPSNGIFNFTTINVPSGMTVKFIKNSANTPVFMLAAGDVNVAGTINLNGEDGRAPAIGNMSPAPGGKGGPGGFDGGYGGVPGGLYGSPDGVYIEPGHGQGPGGGNTCNTPGGYMVTAVSTGVGGSFGTAAYNFVNCTLDRGVYGSTHLLPLIGGSGGAGGYYDTYTFTFGGSGGGGGGAILIASSGSITISGAILANGGAANAAYSWKLYGGEGSGGAIKLVANSIDISSGHLFATFVNGFGGDGRIRLEGNTVNPGTLYVSYNPVPSIGTPGPFFTPLSPSLSITSIAGIAVPPTSAGSYITPDVSIPSTVTNPVSIVITATNIPVGTSIAVLATPQSGAPGSTSATLAGTDTSSNATVSMSLSTTYPTVITAQTTFNIQTAMYYNGEKIAKVKVASSLTSKDSKVTYITSSGKEIPSEIIFASLIK